MYVCMYVLNVSVCVNELILSFLPKYTLLHQPIKNSRRTFKLKL